MSEEKNPQASDYSGYLNEATRPTVRGQMGIVSSGHVSASLAGLDILRAGGNAVDAGVACGICINVLLHENTTFSGVAPIILYQASTNQVVSISGLGRWPRNASIEYFWEQQDGLYLNNLAHCVVPAAPDAWTSVLQRYGTMSLEEVMKPAISHARDGFPVHDYMANTFATRWHELSRWRGSRAVAGPAGKPLQRGEIIVQSDLANTLESIVKAERETLGTREERIRAARDSFYTGDVAEIMTSFAAEHSGFLTCEDFAEFSVQEEDVCAVRYKGYEVHTCGPWCQGPVFAQALSILKNFDLQRMGHNSAEYIHTVTEALNLSFADREYYYGDPEFVDVPMVELIDDEYGHLRANLIRQQQAWGELPPPGNPRDLSPTRNDYEWPPAGDWATNRQKKLHSLRPEPDTSYLCVVDSQGNMFSATPSDTFTTYLSPPIVPGIGLPVSGRGRQSRLDPNHPSSIAPWKRPRLTPSPALVMKDGKPLMAIGTPGGDVQPQAMLQSFLNVVEFGMDPQLAVEAPRFVTASHPNSFYPYFYAPGVIRVESTISETVIEKLRSMGHRVETWPPRYAGAGSVCIAGLPLTNGVLQAGADNRWEAVALGW
jgi:gamma-glutamyltranspeptidase / glutathione hydrolase